MTPSLITGLKTSPALYTFDGLFIDGKWRAGHAGSVLEVNNPSGLGRFGSEGLIHELTTGHWMSVQHVPRQYPF